VLKHGWAHRQQTSLTQIYRNLFPNVASASVPAVTVLRSSLSMYVFLWIIFFFIACFVNSSLLEVTFWIALVFHLVWALMFETFHPLSLDRLAWISENWHLLAPYPEAFQFYSQAISVAVFYFVFPLAPSSPKWYVAMETSNED
jgi:hypothetical protein